MQKEIIGKFHINTKGKFAIKRFHIGSLYAMAYYMNTVVVWGTSFAQYIYVYIYIYTY